MDSRNLWTERVTWAAYGALALAAWFRLRARVDLEVLLRELTPPRLEG